MKSKQALIFTLLAISPALLFKWLQRNWSSDELHFLLYPVQWLVAVFTGQSSVYLAGEGYQFSGFIIEKSCAGVNFLVICWCTLAYLSIQNQHNQSIKIKALLWSIPLSYGLCILANTFRILSALVLQRLPGQHGPNAHEALGVVVYLSILLLATALFHHFLNDSKHAKLA
jgi:exosortase K